MFFFTSAPVMTRQKLLEKTFARFETAARGTKRNYAVFNVNVRMSRNSPTGSQDTDNVVCKAIER